MSGWGEDTSSGWGATDSGFGGGDENNNSEAKSKGCFNCGQEGHRKSDCPEEPKKRGCFKCGEEGHMSRECPNPGSGDGDKKKGCFKCGDEGHMSKDCEKPDTCRKCGEEGHMARDCEKPDTCRRCGEEGHMVRDCPKPMETRVIEDEDGKKREIYVPPSEVEGDALFENHIASGINFDKFDDIKVQTTGNNTPKELCRSFADSKLRNLLKSNIAKSGYTKPTPIQKHAIPIILEKRDLMACAQTGSGKTAAFLLPILHTLLEEDNAAEAGASPQCPRAVVVAPTRELAIQIKDEARKFAMESCLKACVVYGGTSTGYQLMQVFKGVDVLIATPGRLMDFVDKGKISFENVKYLVLDEADRMLDMGFAPEIMRITSAAGMPPKGTRQTLMFSATFPEEVQVMAKEYLEDYLFVTVGIVGGANSDVAQHFHETDRAGKRDKLKEILDDMGGDKTLVFVETKKNADFLATFLSENGYPTTSIHGDRLQREREEALRDFKSGKRPVLVATAVAARGLDIKGVSHVVNYDLPKSIDEYVHRIGRTGRVGNTGKATSFYDERGDRDLAPDLVKILGISQVPVPEWLADQAAGGSAGDGPDANGFGGTDMRGGGEEEEW